MDTALALIQRFGPEPVSYTHLDVYKRQGNDMIEKGIAAPLAAALAAKGYESLTAVQDAVLNSEATGRDLLVSAQTGSGKTVAFGIAIADEILQGSDRLLYADKPLALSLIHI